VTNIPAPGVAPPDRIELRGLRALGIHGVLPEERERPQPFEVDVDLEVELLNAGRSDDLADTVDYGTVAEAVVAAVAGPHLDLLEALAERIAAAAWRAAGKEYLETGSAELRVLPSRPPRVTGVTVAVRKLRPPVGVDMSSAGVRIHRYADQLGGSAGESAPVGDR